MQKIVQSSHICHTQFPLLFFNTTALLGFYSQTIKSTHVNKVYDLMVFSIHRTVWHSQSQNIFLTPETDSCTQDDPPPLHNRSAVSFLYPLATFHLLEASLALCNHQLFSASVDLPILAISYKWNQNVCFSEWHLSFSKMFSGLSMWWYQVSLLHPFYSQTIFHNTDTPVFFIHSSADGHMGWVVSTVPFGYCE